MTTDPLSKGLAAPDPADPSAHVRRSELFQKLDEIEAEMRRIGYWQENPPDLPAKIASGELPSHLDAPLFELWLQTVFLPNARRGVQTNSLPTESQIGLMAMHQYDFQSCIPTTYLLIRLLRDFDKLAMARA